MLLRLIALAALIGVLSGCVVGQSVPLDHMPQEAQHKSRNIMVSVNVDDSRSFVVNKEEDPNYIGEYRSGFGIPYNVTIANSDTLAKQIRSDLEEELRNLGFILGEASKTLLVSIREWNFDAYINTRFWYEIRVAVLGKSGTAIVTDTIEDELNIEGSVWVGPVFAVEEELPQYYNEIIDKLLRGNPKILAALNSN